jgi:CRP/FNR family transcriptional regulator
VVSVSRRSDEGKSVIFNIHRPLEFFGESVFLQSSYYPEEARALADSHLMSWTSYEIEKPLSQTPSFALSLIQMMARRTADLTVRIESLCRENVDTRITKLLLRLASRSGTRLEDGSVRMIPVTHEVLAQYVGCSREAVSMHMSRLRRMGVVRYSQRETILNMNALEGLLCVGGSAEAMPSAAAK